LSGRIGVGKRSLRCSPRYQASGADEEFHVEVVLLDHVFAREITLCIGEQIHATFERRVRIFMDLDAHRFARHEAAATEINCFSGRIIEPIGRNFRCRIVEDQRRVKRRAGAVCDTAICTKPPRMDYGY